MNAVTGGEGQAAFAVLNRLAAAADQVHLDPALRFVVEGQVLKLTGLEIGVQNAVDVLQDVAIEGGGEAPGVVVGGVEDGAVLRGSGRGPR